jgi:hypothetical protein
VMGLILLPLFALYVLISIIIVICAIIFAKKRKKNVFLWGGVAAFIMYNLVFWDWIPTVAVHKYYCSTQAGFWIYKSLDQWKAENPGVIETLTPYKGKQLDRIGDMKNYKDTYHLNQRFDLIVKHNGKYFINRWRHEQEIIDTKNNEVLARYIDFSTSQERIQAGWAGWKLWLASQHCSGGALNYGKMIQFESKFEKIGRKEEK